MLIVTPAKGSWPEPRPQQLITGDRAIRLLDNVSSAALQTAGVKMATVSKATYQQLVDELIPEAFEGLDENGKLIESVIPSRLSAAAINALNLRGIDGKLDPTYLPSYLTTDGLASLMGAANSTVIETDPDGTPVVLGGDATSINISVSGTATIGTVNAGTAHGDLVTGTLAQFTTVQANNPLILGGSSGTPAAPSAGFVKIYADTNGRLNTRDDSGAVYRYVTTRTVTNPTWSSLTGQVGETVVNTSTGEQRTYLGSSLGWRLAAPFEVATVSARDALNTKYQGYRVYVTELDQECVWHDNEWHGTQTVYLGNQSITAASNVNDTNFRVWSTTNVPDPGYKYVIRGQVDMEVVVPGALSRAEVWFSYADLSNGANQNTFSIWYDETTDRYKRCQASPFSDVISGSKKVIVSWRMRANNSAAFSGNYQAYVRWALDPV